MPTLEPRELAKFRTSLEHEDVVFLFLLAKHETGAILFISFSQTSPKLHLPLDLPSSNTNSSVIKGGNTPNHLKVEKHQLIEMFQGI